MFSAVCGGGFDDGDINGVGDDDGDDKTITDLSLDLDGEHMMWRRYDIQQKKLIREKIKKE